MGTKQAAPQKLTNSVMPPESVMPLPKRSGTELSRLLNVIELSWRLERLLVHAPGNVASEFSGKTRLSPFTGVTPPQLAGTLQRRSPPNGGALQTRVAAEAICVARGSNTTAKA